VYTWDPSDATALQICAQNRSAFNCFYGDDSEGVDITQSQSCTGAEECLADGLQVTVFTGALAPDFDNLEDYIATDVSFDLRSTFLWGVDAGDSVFSTTLTDVSASYMLLFEGTVQLQQSGVHVFRVDSNFFTQIEVASRSGELAVAANERPETRQSRAPSEPGNYSSETEPVYFEGGDVIGVEVLSWRGDGSHDFKIEMSLDNATFVSLECAGVLSFEFPNENDKCFDENSGVACSGRGLCFEGACTCDYGYAGDKCQEEACERVGCFNGGVCTGNGQCVCSSPWTGLDCNECEATDFSCLSQVESIVTATFSCVGAVVILLGVRRVYHTTQPRKKKTAAPGTGPSLQTLEMLMDFHTSTTVIPLARLRNLKLIAAGSQGQVYSAAYGQATVAVKKYFVPETSDRNVPAWKREAALLKQVRHPNVLKFFGVVTDDASYFYIVTELASFSMADLVLDGGKSSPSVLRNDHEGDGGMMAKMARQTSSPSDYCMLPSGDEAQFLGVTIAERSPSSSSDSSSQRATGASLGSFLRNSEDRHADIANQGLRDAWRGSGNRHQDDASKAYLTLEIARQLIEAVVFIHRHHVVHRDLTPANILFVDVVPNRRGRLAGLEGVHERWRLTLGDFGLARFCLPGVKDLTTLVGSPHYVAPELMKGETDYSHKVDVYSYGMVLWALLHGEHPMKGDGVCTIIDKIVHRHERPRIRKDCPPFFAKLIDECWCTDPAMRPAAQEILDRVRVASDWERRSSAVSMGLLGQPPCPYESPVVTENAKL
jgi:serine/threonine protein kinase